jgi:hypothetical protein
LIEFLFIYSPINAPINGQSRIPRIHPISQTIVQIAAHRVQCFDHPNFFVVRIGKKLSIMMTAIMIINRITKNSVENGLPHIK